MMIEQALTDVETDPWQVRLTVVWRDEALPVPIDADARTVAGASGVRLSTRPGSCVAHFTIDSVSVRDAVDRALSRWADIVVEAALPNWEIVSFSVDQIDAHDLGFTRIG